MMKRIAWVFAIGLLCGGFANAQEQGHKLEVTGDYSYFRANPGLPSYFNSQNLNGGGGQVTYFITPNIGLAGDLQGYGSYTQCTKPGAPVAGCASGNLFTYMFGPQLKARRGKLEPFGEVLFGGAHSKFYGNACTKTGICGSKSPSTRCGCATIALPTSCADSWRGSGCVRKVYSRSTCSWCSLRKNGM